MLHGPDSHVDDHEQVRLAVAVPSAGLFLTGLATLLFWFCTVLFVLFEHTHPQAELSYWQPSSLLWMMLILICSLIVPVSAVLMTGAVMMRRLRSLCDDATEPRMARQ